MNRYPWWKYVLLVVVVVVAIIYALPNLYGDDPSVQVSSDSIKVTVTEATLNQVEQALHQANLAYKSAQLEADKTIVVRFSDTNEQLKAQTIVSALLGDQYTVAINLLPRTPHWLRNLGASPAKLGLDLRGGVHFLLQVDVHSVVARRLQSDMRTMSDALRKADIRYKSIHLDKDNALIIDFRDEATLNRGLDLLTRQFSDLSITPVKQPGALQLSAMMTPATIADIRDYTMDQTMTVLRNRINELGVAEPIVQQQGEDRVQVDLPGIQDATQAKQILGGTATLQFHLVDEQNSAQAAAATGTVPFGDKLYEQTNGQPILLKNQIILSGTSIISASSTLDQDGRPSVSIRLGGSDVSYFNQVTGDNVGHLMAMVYVETRNESHLVNGKVVIQSRKIERVINAATIQSALGVNFQVTGLGSQQEAKKLAMLLRAGALPANLTIIEDSTIGPSLGKENIRAGMLSVEAGFILIAVIMAIYYRVFGLFADAALTLNLVLLLAILSLLGATLSLPAIAGMVLTVGMAVDANVLINERIREELRNGVAPQASIAIGYEKAFGTILDANVTTFIVALVLFFVGTGPIKGFAITLCIGILTSMFTAIFGTRALVNLVYGGRAVKKLSIGI